MLMALSGTLALTLGGVIEFKGNRAGLFLGCHGWLPPFGHARLEVTVADLDVSTCERDKLGLGGLTVSIGMGLAEEQVEPSGRGVVLRVREVDLNLLSEGDD